MERQHKTDNFWVCTAILFYIISLFFLLSAHIKRFSVSRMRDFCLQPLKWIYGAKTVLYSVYFRVLLHSWRVIFPKWLGKAHMLSWHQELLKALRVIKHDKLHNKNSAACTRLPIMQEINIPNFEVHVLSWNAL